MIVVTRESYKKHPILSAIVESIDKKDLIGVYNVKKLKDIIKIIKGKKKIVITTDPIVFLLTVFLCPFGKKIFFSLEMFEHQTFNKGLNILRNLLFKGCHFIALKRSDIVVFSNKARYRFYLYKKWVNKEKSHIIENSPSLQSLDIMDKIKTVNKLTLRRNIYEKYGLPKNWINKDLYVYAGSLSKARGINQIIDLFKNNCNCVLIIAGNDRENQFKDVGFKNIFFVGMLSKKESLELIWLADYQIANYSTKLLNTRFCAPVKAYESIYLNTPLIVNNNTGISSLSIYNNLTIYKNLKNLDLSSLKNKNNCDNSIVAIEHEIKKILYSE